MRVTVRAVARDQCTHRRMGGLVRAHRCARVAARAAPRVRDGGAGLGVRALRPGSLECHRDPERHAPPSPRRPARRVRGGHATGDPGWAPLESGIPLVCCRWRAATAVQGRDQGDWASRARAPPPCLLAQLSGRFASPRNLWCVQERPAAAPPYEGLRRL